MRDFSEDLADLSRRVRDARAYLRIEETLARLEELDAKAADPDLWNDTDNAQQVMSELSRVRADVETISRLEARVSDVETLFEMGREEADDSVAPEIEETGRRHHRHDLPRIGTDRETAAPLLQPGHHPAGRVQSEGAASGEEDRVDAFHQIARIEGVRLPGARPPAPYVHRGHRAAGRGQDDRAAREPAVPGQGRVPDFEAGHVRQ